MIRFALRCAKSHEFDAWFRNGDTYDRQAKRGEIRCPECGTDDVRKAIMAPAIAKRSGRARGPTIDAVADAPAADAQAQGGAAPGGAAASAAAVPAPAASLAPAEAAAMHIAGRLREALREMRRHVEKNAEYVGPRFADEARKIHHGEAEERSIYGEASRKEAEALKDEGIEFGHIPWIEHDHDA